jgi:autotransporter-associated beta strand protein
MECAIALRRILSRFPTHSVQKLYCLHLLNTKSIMKPKFRNSLFLSTITLALFATSAAQADTYYWDNTSPIEDAGFGSASGTWGTDAFWSASSVGTDSTGIVGPLTTDILNFGTVSDVLGVGTVTVSGTQSANSITFGVGSGAISLSGGTIDLASTANINVDNSADTISSVLSGAGTSLTKAGTGILTLSGANTFTGVTNINNGTLKIGNAAALGAQTGTADGTIIASGATLDLGGIGSGTLNQSGSVGAERITASGVGVGGNGAILSSAAIPTNFIGVRHLTLADNTTLGFTNRWDVGSNNSLLPSSLVGGGFTLNLIGSGTGQASLNFLGETDLGDININLGSATTAIVYLQGSTTLGRTTNTATITGGSALEIFSSNTNTIFDKKFALNNGILNVGRAATLPGTISLTTATNTINANAATAASGVISGTGSLIKGGASTLTLSNANTYSGSTTVTNGTLSINSIKDINGGSSAVGAPTTPADGTINIGSGTNSTVFTYTGTGNTTDRVINLASTTGGLTFNQSGSGLLKFTSAFTATGNGAKTLTLQGSTAGSGEISGAIVNNGTVFTPTTTGFAAAATTMTLSDVTGLTVGSRITGTGIAATTATTITAINTTTKVVTISPAAASIGASGQTMTITASTALTKAGTGTWTLSGANTYTGTTSLSTASVLRINNGASIPGGIGAAGGTSYLLFNNGSILGLGGTGTQPVFARAHGVNLVNGFYLQSNGGWAAFDQDRIVNVGGAGATQQWLNGKTIILGHSTATHKVTYVNGMTLTSVTRPLQVDDGSGAIDGQISGVFTQSAGAVAGIDKTGAGTLAVTGDSTFAGSLVVRSGTVIVNKVTNTGTASPIGLGTSGFTLAGGTFQYAPVSGVGGGAASVNRTFGITASSSLDASGTGALDLNNTGNISPDVTGQTGSWAASGSANITGLTSTANMAIGMRVTGTGIPANAVITQILSSTSVTLSANTTALGTSAPVTFGYPSARTLTLTGTNTDANTLAGILQDSSSLGAGVLSLAKTGVGTWSLSGANSFTGNIVVSNGSLIGQGATNSPGISAFGSRTNTRTITINNGGTLQFNSGNILGANHTATTAPTLVINSGGIVTNGGSATNNSLNDVQLNDGTLTSTTGHTSSSPPNLPVYGAWNINGLVTSTGISTISTSDPTKGWLMLKVTGDKTTEFSVTSGTLTVSAPVVDNPTDSNIGSLTKSGAGAMILSGVNTYSGNTAVNAGSLALADNAQLKFITGATSGASNSISGTGTLTIDGDFNIDTTITDATALTSGTWVLVNASTLSETFTSSFTIIGAGWSETANVWTKTVGNKTYTFTEADGTLVLSSASSYATWIDSFFPSESNPAIIGADADPDNDGIENGVEMVIGGNPATVNDLALLPTIELVSADPDDDTTFADYLLFTYRRSDLSVDAGVTADCEIDTDLVAPWTLASEAPGTVIIEDNNFTFTPPTAANTERVRVFVPKDINTKLFGRLYVEVP